MIKMNHPFNEETCINRLLKEYSKHNKLIIAFDFDNTIFDFHNNGGDYSEVIELLKDCSDMNMTMVLFTCDDDNDILKDKVEFCNKNEIWVDYINESPVYNTKKPYYNILLDDRAGLNEAYSILYKVINVIKENSYGKGY